MNEDFYINLIYKNISGEITDPEKEELDNWLAASEENQLMAKSVEVAWENSESRIKIPDVNLDEEFSSLEDRMDESPDIGENSDTPIVPITKTGKKYSSKTVWWSMAASVAVLLSIGYFVQQRIFTNNYKQWAEVTTQNNTKVIVLSDSTQISLNRYSTLKYPKEFPKEVRLVKLEGEAFFNVAHNAKQPFFIETQLEKIKVLGTSFNVRAHIDESYASVYVAEGRVQFVPKGASSSIILEKGNKGIL